MTDESGSGPPSVSRASESAPDPGHRPPWARPRSGYGGPRRGRAFGPRHRPPWAEEGWHDRRRRYSSRFRGFILLMVLLIAGGSLIFAYLLTRLFGGDSSTVLIVWLSGCGLSLLIPMLLLAGAARAYGRYAVPLADIMDAADAVAAGDLDVRVEPKGSRDFRRLAGSFNRMTEELARTDQQRRNLTADVAHELRTPLHIIQGNLEGILDGVYEPSPEHVEATVQETRTLARLVDDLGTLSLAESGELPLHLEAVDVADLLLDAATSFSPPAEAAGVELRVNVPSDQEAIVFADAGRLDQVLGNLIGNAIRHTPSGGSVTLGAQQAGGSVRITVTDTGEGIPPDDLPYVFDRFWRGDRSRTRRSDTPNSGLGLAIASQLVQAHGGHLSAESEPGAGATFTVELPIGEQDATDR